MNAQVYRKLQYFVPMPGKAKKDGSGKKARLELLKNISGAAVPGQLTALMGGSGAGKVCLGAPCAIIFTTPGAQRDGIYLYKPQAIPTRSM